MDPPIQNDDRVPLSSLEKLDFRGGYELRVTSRWQEKNVLRCTVESTMSPAEAGDGIVFKQELQPGETCEALVKIPYIALDSPDEMTALSALDFDESYRQIAGFWREEARAGAQLKTPEPHLNELYAAHLSHVQVTDFAMPDDGYLVNTSVGSSTYGNFTNESCMIVQDLDQRSLHEEARRRLSVWLKYQGTVGLRGSFTDHEGVFYGAGGFEMGETYNQHHGWVLWRLAEHYFATWRCPVDARRFRLAHKGSRLGLQAAPVHDDRSPALPRLGIRLSALRQPGGCRRLLLLAFD